MIQGELDSLIPYFTSLRTLLVLGIEDCLPLAIWSHGKKVRPEELAARFGDLVRTARGALQALGPTHDPAFQATFEGEAHIVIVRAIDERLAAVFQFLPRTPLGLVRLQVDQAIPPILQSLNVDARPSAPPPGAVGYQPIPTLEAPDSSRHLSRPPPRVATSRPEALGQRPSVTAPADSLGSRTPTARHGGMYKQTNGRVDSTDRFRQPAREAPPATTDTHPNSDVAAGAHDQAGSDQVGAGDQAFGVPSRPLDLRRPASSLMGDTQISHGAVGHQKPDTMAPPSSVQAPPVQAPPGQANPGQANPGQANPGQANPGQANPGQAFLTQVQAPAHDDSLTRGQQLLGYLERYAADTHTALLRVSLQTGLPLTLLRQPDRLTDDEFAVVSESVRRILGVDHLAL